MAFYTSAARESSMHGARRAAAAARHLYATIHFPEEVWQTLMRHIPYAPTDLAETIRRRLREARETYLERSSATPVRLVVLTANQLDRLETWLLDAVSRVAPAAITSALRCVQAARRVRVISQPPALAARIVSAEAEIVHTALRRIDVTGSFSYAR